MERQPIAVSAMALTTGILMFGSSCFQGRTQHSSPMKTHTFPTHAGTTIVRHYYQSGAILAEIPLNDGQKEGVARWYHPNGSLWMRISYHRGQYDGEFMEWWSTGGPWVKGTYSKGREQGVWTYWYSDGFRRFKRVGGVVVDWGDPRFDDLREQILADFRQKAPSVETWALRERVIRFIETGMPAEELERLLGRADSVAANGEWVYELIPQHSSIRVAFDELERVAGCRLNDVKPSELVSH